MDTKQWSAPRVRSLSVSLDTANATGSVADGTSSTTNT